MLGQLTGEDEADGSLDLTRGDGGLLVVGSQLGCLGSDSLEDVLDKGVEDGHGLGGDTSVWVNLLEDTVDEGRVGLLAGLAGLLLVTRGGGLGLGGSLLGGLSGGLASLSWGLAGLGGGGLSGSGSGLRGLFAIKVSR